MKIFKLMNRLKDLDEEARVREISKYMKMLVKDASTNDTIRRKAISIIEPLREKTKENVVRELWKFVRDEIKYIPDPRGFEALVHPALILEGKYPGGDCDDKAILLASMWRSVDVEGVGFLFLDAGKSGVFNHVVPVVKFGFEVRKYETTSKKPENYVAPHTKEIIDFID